jgi:hypothetical protein
MRIYKIKKNLKNREARGEIIKSIGLGMFVNGLYGISDSSVESYNIVDIIVSLYTILLGISIEKDI